MQFTASIELVTKINITYSIGLEKFHNHFTDILAFSYFHFMLFKQGWSHSCQLMLLQSLTLAQVQLGCAYLGL